MPTFICNDFANLRDIFSLFPQNIHFKVFLSEILKYTRDSDCDRLLADCNNKRVILIASCHQRLSRAETSLASYENLDRDVYHPIILLGSSSSTPEDRTALTFSYDGLQLRLPIPDAYEHLHRKLFFAFMILDLIAQPDMVFKQDDDLLLDNQILFQDTLDRLGEKCYPVAGRLVGSEFHKNQLHGWHIGKCSSERINKRGYQYPLPARYPAGGYGYLLRREGLKACTYMYLAMKEFFNMTAIGLEDAYVGHALYASGLDCVNIADSDTLLCFPGLITAEFQAT